MAHEKLYTARQAAELVLKKTHELLEKNEHKHIGWNKLHGKLEGEGYSKESADKIAGSIKAKMDKAENSGKENAKPSEHDAKDADQHAEGKGPKGEIHPKEPAQGASDSVSPVTPPSQDPGKEAGGPGSNPGPGAFPRNEGEPYKGHIKLAKFIGHMESKRLTKSKMVPNG